MNISGAWLTAAATQQVCALLQDADYQALLVGGCVRNALLGAPVNDIDISTDARPDVVMKLAKAAGLNAVPTGIEHGTVTVVADGTPHEITTFRRDIETDGRRAVVAFSAHVEDDARRRDFTMNALYARADGTVVDPLGGMDDLQARRVRFIDDADLRIREDYLRSLRYFRFHALYGDPHAGLDPDALDAIARHVDGLAALSRERVGTEILKLLAAPDPAPSVAAMRQVGVLAAVLDGADDRALAPLVHLETQAGLQVDALRRLAVLGGQNVDSALRLSNKKARELAELRAGVESTQSPGALGYRHGADIGQSIVVLRAALLETPLMRADLAAAQAGAQATFPISASDLMPDVTGPDLGVALRRLENLWIASEFRLSKLELLRHL